MADYYDNLTSFILNSGKPVTNLNIVMIGSTIQKTTKPLIVNVKQALLTKGLRNDQIQTFMVKDVTDKTSQKLIDVINRIRPDHVIILNEKVPGEVQFRKILRQHAIKYGTFSDIPFASKRLIELSFTRSYQAIQHELLPIYRKLKRLKKIRVKNDRGTDITVEFSAKYRWVNSNGHVAKQGTEPDVAPSGNLFPAEFYTHPTHINGTLVADAFYLAALQLDRYRNKPQLLHQDLQKNPITVTIKNNKIVNATCANKKMLAFAQREIFEIDPVNGARIGEFALPGLLTSSIEYFKFPPLLEKIRVHIAHGHGYGEKTGCTYDSPVHGDFGIDNAVVIDLMSGKIIFKDHTYDERAGK